MPCGCYYYPTPVFPIYSAPSPSKMSEADRQAAYNRFAKRMAAEGKTNPPKQPENPYPRNPDSPHTCIQDAPHAALQSPKFDPKTGIFSFTSSDNEGLDSSGSVRLDRKLGIRNGLVTAPGQGLLTNPFVRNPHLSKDPRGTILVYEVLTDPSSDRTKKENWTTYSFDLIHLFCGSTDGAVHLKPADILKKTISSKSTNVVRGRRK